MSEQSRRTQHATNAAAGLGLIAAGEGMGHFASARASRAGRVSSMILPRGVKAVGVPLAATGVVGAARNRGRADRVDLTKLPKQVAHGTVKIPRARRKAATQTAADTGAAVLGGTATGYLLRRAGRTPAGRVALGTVGSVGGASSALYGRQKGRESGRRRARLAKAEPQQHQRTFRLPVPTVADTHEDWKLHRQRRRTANTSIAAAGVGAAALAARAPHLVKPKKPSQRLLKLRSRGNKLSEGLGAGAVLAGLYSAGTGYSTNRHDLDVQARRLRERDALLHRRSPVNKDAFTRKYGNRISPQAESGYEYLRQGRNRQARSAALNTGLTAVNATAALRGGKVMRPVGLGLGAITGTQAVRQYRGAKRWEGHMKKIRAKAYERAGQGVYGRDREIAKDDLSKALLRVRPPGLPFPKGLRRAPAMRAGSVRRTASGKMVAFRGSYG